MNSEHQLDRQEMEILRYFLGPGISIAVPSKVLPRVRRRYPRQVTKKGVSKRFQSLEGKNYLENIGRANGQTIYRLNRDRVDEIRKLCEIKTL